MIGNATLQAHHGRDPATGPSVAPEAIGLGAAGPQRGQTRPLVGGQPPGRARGRPMAQGLRAAVAGAPHPLADRGFADAQGLGHLALRPALLPELPGLEPSGFCPVARCAVHAYKGTTTPSQLKSFMLGSVSA
jgi:hypothetical protein